MKKNPVIDLEAQRRKKQVISKIESIPPLPAAAHEVLSIVAENPKDIRRLEQVIMHDPSLSLQLLKVANCAAYYPATRITSIQRAIVFLGFAEVRNIALSLCISSVFKGKRSKSDFDRQAFWEHSIGVAMISRIIAAELGLEDIDIYFTCGLLHDIGRLVMDFGFPEIWKQIITKAHEEDIPLLKSERFFGYQHNLVGAWLAKSWGLPKIYIKTIVSHHLPIRHPHFCFDGAIIKLADCLCHDIGLGMFAQPICNKYGLGNFLGLGEERLALLEEHLVKIGEIAEAITQGWL